MTYILLDQVMGDPPKYDEITMTDDISIHI